MDECALSGQAQDLPHAVFEVQLVGGVVKAGLLHEPWVHLVVGMNFGRRVRMRGYGHGLVGFAAFGGWDEGFERFGHLVLGPVECRPFPA